MAEAIYNLRGFRFADAGRKLSAEIFEIRQLSIRCGLVSPIGNVFDFGARWRPSAFQVGIPGKNEFSEFLWRSLGRPSADAVMKEINRFPKLCHRGNHHAQLEAVLLKELQEFFLF